MGLMDLINQAGGIVNKAAPIIALGTGVSGTIGNIAANKQRNQAVQQSMAMTEEQRAMQRYYQQLALKAQAPAAMTPQEMATAISQLQRPLGQGLTTGVSNLVQANMAERGLGQSPAVFSQVMAQALAPYLMQQQQLATSAFSDERNRATQQYMQMLGLPISARAPLPNYTPYNEPTSTAGSWATFLNLMSKRQPNGPFGASRLPFPMPTPRIPASGTARTYPTATPPWPIGQEPGSGNSQDPGIDWAKLLDSVNQPSGPGD